MVLIKGMQMPNNCSTCCLRDLYYGECNVTHRKIRSFVNSNSRPSWCPLFEVEEFGVTGLLYKETYKEK